MKLRPATTGLLIAAVLAFVLAVSLPVRAFGRGQGRGRDKKAEKFINGHDARDGRWDGRGPRPRFARARRPHPPPPPAWKRHSRYWRGDRHRRHDETRYR